MLCPAIKESLEIRDYCCDIQYLSAVVSCLLLKAVSNIRRTKAITIQKSSDPTDLVRKVLE